MKRINALFFAVLLFAFANQVSAFGQDLVTWEWETYKVKFTVPDNFKIQENNAEAFIAGNEDINLSIYPSKGEMLTRNEMKNALKNWAKENKVTNLSEIIQVDDEKLNGYWGIFVEGTANDLPAFLMQIIDPDYPDISLYVWLNYQEDEKLAQTCINILTSFTPMQ